MKDFYDFKNKDNYEKTLKLVKKLKAVKIKKNEETVKCTGRIAQVIKPNEVIIKTKMGKHIGVVFEGGLVEVFFDKYDRTLIALKDASGNEFTLDYNYDVTIVLGKKKDFTFDGKIYEGAAREFIKFWGIER